MIRRWIYKYFATIFLLATLMGVFHHHSDFKVHENCQICVIQANIADGDTPTDIQYIKLLEYNSQELISYKEKFYLYDTFSSLRARAPPKQT